MIIGDVGMYLDICSIIMNLILGVSMDIIGRKLLIIVGFLIVSICLGMMPFFHSVYPSFLMFKIFIGVGILPAAATPLLPDYIVESSRGLGEGYVRI
jgi:MFS family permease